MTWRHSLGGALIVACLIFGGVMAVRFKQSCVVDGKRYYPGEGMPSLDGCNSYWCQDGKVMSTLKFCIQAPP